MIGAEEANIGFELALNGFCSGDTAVFGQEDITDVGEVVQVCRPLPLYYPGGPVSQ